MFEHSIKGVIDSIKFVKAGEYEGRAYDASITLTFSEIKTIEDDEIGSVEKEIFVSVKVPVKSLKKAYENASKLKKDSVPVSLVIDSMFVKGNSVLLKSDKPQFG